mmetsp:Transcript_18324/g.48367  ORF Transcript_18324/g.48367 Transcript_18324/m.48367 type:complete len:369 (-) Transcript_18324:32-1138(-)
MLGERLRVAQLLQFPVAQYLDRLGHRLDLLGAQLLAGLEVGRLLGAGGRELREVLLVLVASGRCVREVALGVGLGLELLGLEDGLLLAVRGALLDLRLQVLKKHVVRVVCVHLLLLHGRLLVDELVEQLFEHLDDAAQVRLVRVRLWRRDGQRLGCLSIHWVLLDERVQRPFRFGGDQAQALEVLDRFHLRKAGLLHRPGLRLQVRDRTLQGVHRLGIVRVQGLVVRLLELANLGGSLLITIPGGDVGVVLRDLLRQLCGVLGVLLDGGLQHLDPLVSLFNCTPLPRLGVVAELLVGGELDLLRLLLLLALLHHALHERDNLLHRSHRLSARARGGRCHGHESAQVQKNCRGGELHCCPIDSRTYHTV